MTAPPFEIATHLEGLALALSEGAWLWRARPFSTTTPPWAERAPELADFCLALDDAAVVALEAGGPLPPGAPPLLRDWVERLAGLTRVAGPAEQVANTTAEGVRTSVDWRWQVPGRKLEQVVGFAEVALDLAQRAHDAPTGRVLTRVLDWCGGRGHLGRTLGLRLGLPVSVLELDPAHAEPARQLAERLGVEVELVTCDALSDDAAALVARLPADMLAVGLHACGALGERLVTLASARGVMALAHSPCCLHKVPGLKESHYRPLSRAAARALSVVAPRANLVLDHSALRLATSDEVVARPALRAARQKENTWRLALDLLLQDALGTSDYTPLGTLPSELLSRPFEDFAREAASRRGLPLPAAFDPERALVLGAARALRARRFGLVRSLFRRAIELFVVLDRAAFLVERGYEVAVVEFAPRRLTPRNLLITARLGR